jgi:hypothetical protein
MKGVISPAAPMAILPEPMPASLRAGLSCSGSHATTTTDGANSSNSAVLQTKIELTCGDLGRALGDLWRHPDPADRFPRFLILLHQIMRASVPLMEEAVGVARARIGKDPMAAPLLRYLSTHLEEEANHDLWTLEDLEAAGFDAAAAEAQMPSPDLAAMVGAQYYWIRHHHPLALLGYIAILEGNPPAAAHIDRIRSTSGLPEGAFRTYRLHGSLDPQHREELWHTLDAMPLGRDHAALIALSAFHTARTLAVCLDHLDAVALPPRRCLGATRP